MIIWSKLSSSLKFAVLSGLQTGYHLRNVVPYFVVLRLESDELASDFFSKNQETDFKNRKGSHAWLILFVLIPGFSKSHTLFFFKFRPSITDSRPKFLTQISGPN